MSESQMVISLKMLTDMGDNISEIDTLLDSVSGAPSAGKRAVVNRLVKSVQDNVDAVLRSLEFQVFNPVQKDELGNPVLDDEGNPLHEMLPDDIFVGMLNGILRGLDSKYTTRQDEILESKAEEIKKETDAIKLTEDQIKELVEKRKNLVMQFRATKEVFKSFGMEGVDEVPDPKKRTGSRGKRGPRAISMFTWTVDGVRQPQEKDSLTGVAADNGYENSKALRDAMRAAGINLKEPEDKIDFKLQNGKVLVGIKKEEDEEDDDEDEEDSEDESAETED